MLISILKHLYLLPGYVIRIVWTVWVIIGGYKKMDWGDGVKFLASYTQVGLAIYSLLGWLAIGLLMFSDHSPRNNLSNVYESHVVNVSAPQAHAFDKRSDLPIRDQAISEDQPTAKPSSRQPLTDEETVQLIVGANAQASEEKSTHIVTPPRETDAPVEKKPGGSDPEAQPVPPALNL
jgi:hypothetical protein